MSNAHLSRRARQSYDVCMEHGAEPKDPAALRAALLDWFDDSRRDLPWRGNATPYAILVSEFMLQQTTVAAAIPYYQRWMKRFPTVAALARAAPEDALRYWAGLGYYSRARNLHRTAQIILSEHRGRVPRDMAALRALPGVGDYTAAAVASMAFGIAAPAIDANAARVYSRLGAVGGGPAASVFKKQVLRLAHEVIDPSRPGDFNQAVMELGALVCTPGAPRCGECPVHAFCKAHAEGRTGDYPQKATRMAPVAAQSAAAVVLRRGAVLLRKRPEGGPMAGLWEPPGELLLDGENPETAAIRAALAHTGVLAQAPRRLFIVKQAFTHHRITVTVMQCAAAPGARIPRALADRASWVLLKDLENYPLTSTGAKILARLKLARIPKS